MQDMSFDEEEMFRAISKSGVRALLIGRRALIVLGLPVLTQDYDFWLHRDDIAAFNTALAHLDLVPNRSPEDALKLGRYRLENDIHIDVLIARAVSTIHGEAVRFDDLWPRRKTVPLTRGVTVTLPSIVDLMATKRFAARPKDAEDLRMLEVLRSKEEA